MGLLNSGCAVSIKDETLYVDQGETGATELHFLSSGQTDLSKSEWDSIREGMVCEPASAFGDFKAEIEELCSKTACSYEVTQAVNNLIVKINAAEK